MNKFKNLLVTTGLILTGVLAFAQAENILAKENANEKPRIIEGVSIGTVDVGGMTEDEAEDALNDYVNGLKNTTFTLTGAKGSIDVTAAEMGIFADVSATVKEALALGQSGSLIERYKATADLENSQVTIDLNLGIDKQMTGQLLYGKRDKLNIQAIHNGLSRQNGTFQYVPGQSGTEVDIVSSVYEIEKFISEWEEGQSEITLITQTVEPKGNEEQLAQVQDLLGTFSTNFSSSASGRAKNVRNGCAKINGTIVYPGDEFSVYLAVNPFTKENGYELAGSYLNGTTVESFGGGICQVSTTLYNAAILAELDITMRYNHSMIVNYVDPSADAAIAGTYKDLRFINNYDVPIYIEGVCNGGVITFNIYGKETRQANRTVSYESETLETTNPDTQFNLSSSYEGGYYKVTQSAHKGIKARLWKVVTVDGVEQSREVFNNSTYKASPKIVTIGIGGLSESQIASIQEAINSKDESAVKAAVAASTTPVEPEVLPETPQQPESPEEPQVPEEEPPSSEEVEDSETSDSQEEPVPTTP